MKTNELLAEFLKRASAHKVLPVETAEGTYFVRTITSTDRDKLAEHVKTNGRTNTRGVSVALYLCDEKGVPLVADPFSRETIETFSKLRADVLEEILTVAMNLNRIGVTKEQLEADRKNSSTTIPA